MFLVNDVSQRFHHLGDVLGELQQTVDPSAIVENKDIGLAPRERANLPDRQTRVHRKTPSIGSTNAVGLFFTMWSTLDSQTT